MSFNPYLLGGAAAAGIGTSIFDSLMGDSAAKDAKKAAEAATRRYDLGVDYANAVNAPYQQGGTTAYGAMYGGTGLDFAGKTPNLADFWNTPEANLPGINPADLAAMSPEEQLAYLDNLIATNPRGAERFAAIRKPFAAAVDAFRQSKSGYDQSKEVLGEAPEYQPYEKFSYGGQTPDAPTLEMPSYSGDVPDYQAPERFSYGERPEGFRYGENVPDPLQAGGFENQSRVPTFTPPPGDGPQGFQSDRFTTPLPGTGNPESFKYRERPPDVLQQRGFESESQIPEFSYGGEIPGFSYGGEGPSGYRGGRFGYGDGNTAPEFDYAGQPMSYEAYAGKVPEFVAPTADTVRNDPGYQFRMEQGSRAIQGGAAAKGNLLSGKAQKELAEYGQGLASDEYDRAYNRGLTGWRAEMEGSREGYGRYLDTFDRQRGAEQEKYGRAVTGYGFETSRDATGYNRALERFLTNQGIGRDEWATMSDAEQERYRRAVSENEMGAGREREAYGRATGEYGMATAREGEQYKRGLNEFLTNAGVSEANYARMTEADREKYRRAFEEYGTEQSAEEKRYGRGQTAYGQEKDQFLINQGISREEYDTGRSAEQERYGRTVGEYGMAREAEGAQYQRDFDRFLANYGISQDNYNRLSAAEKERYARAFQEHQTDTAAEETRYGRAASEYDTNYRVGRDTYATQAAIEAERRRRGIEDPQLRNQTRADQFNMNTSAEANRYGRGVNTWQIGYGQNTDEQNVRYGRWGDKYARLGGLSGVGQTAASQAGSNAITAAGNAANNTLWSGGVAANAKTNTAQNITGLVGDIAGAYAYGAGKKKTGYPYDYTP